MAIKECKNVYDNELFVNFIGDEDVIDYGNNGHDEADDGGNDGHNDEEKDDYCGSANVENNNKAVNDNN